LAIGYWLLAIGYWLLAIGYWLLAILARRQIQRTQQLPILIHLRIRSGQELLAIEDGIGAGKETESLGFTREPGPTCGQADARFW
jgi:hypothetical protein